MNQKQAMLQRFQRLQHSEGERASPAALENQGQMTQAVKRIYQRKLILHENMDSAQNVYKRLLFDEAMPKAPLRNATQHITSELRHQAMEQNEDENVGVTAAVQAEQTGERAFSPQYNASPVDWNSSCDVKGMKIAVDEVVRPRWILTALYPRGRQESIPPSCWKSSGISRQLCC